MKTELLRAEAALSRLEEKIKADFHGECHPGGPAAIAEAELGWHHFSRSRTEPRATSPFLTSSTSTACLPASAY